MPFSIFMNIKKQLVSYFTGHWEQLAQITKNAPRAALELQIANIGQILLRLRFIKAKTPRLNITAGGAVGHPRWFAHVRAAGIWW